MVCDTGNRIENSSRLHSLHEVEAGFQHPILMLALIHVSLVYMPTHVSLYEYSVVA
jgi:hypothetical protein